MNRTRIKFCGITSVADAAAAADLGADAIGLILVPQSPRALPIARAAQIAQALPPFVTRVALFRDATAADVRAALTDIAIDVLQFHGDESPVYCAQFERSWIKAVPMGALTDAAALEAFLQDFRGASGFVFDSHGGGQSGGSGHTFDWGRIPVRCPRPVILAGGLMPGNVAAAVRSVRPWAVDVSSGIESAPGIKDHAKMRIFIDEVYRAGTD
jgi:phosphoribosylanthranilate isomerase